MNTLYGLLITLILLLSAFGIVVLLYGMPLYKPVWNCTQSVLIGPEHNQHSKCVQYSRKEEK